MSAPKRIVVGISGASGAIYGVRMLEALRAVPDVETHLIITRGARLTLGLETDRKMKDVLALADVVHWEDDLAASIASGSFRTAGMVVAPCSMKTLAAVAHGMGDNLLTRAADVTLKERPLSGLPQVGLDAPGILQRHIHVNGGIAGQRLLTQVLPWGIVGIEAGDPLQPLGQVGLHPFSHACSENDNVHRQNYKKYKILARTLSIH